MKAIIVLASVSLILIGCGHGSESDSAPSNVAAPVSIPDKQPAANSSTSIGDSCGANMILSQFGCLPQCGIQMAVHNGICIQVVASTPMPICNDVLRCAQQCFTDFPFTTDAEIQRRINGGSGGIGGGQYDAAITANHAAYANYNACLAKPANQVVSYP